MTERTSRTVSIEEDRLLIEQKTSDPMKSFETLYKKYVDQIYGYVWKRIQSAEEAEDITSRVFLAAYQKWPEFKFKECPFSSFLYKIATRELITVYRKTSKVRQVELLEEHAKEDKIEAETEVRLSMEKVQMMLGKIPESYRQVVELKYFAELSNIEIAEVLNCSPNQVAVTLFRALKKIKALATA
ncbi:MAG: sigma-70 family RNA polymerase sigma factor [bacterium]